MSGDESVMINEHIEGFNGGVEEEGNVCFHVTTPEGKDLQLLKLGADGKIYVEGREADSDLEVVAVFKEYVRMNLFPGKSGQLVAEPGFEIIRRLRQRVHELEGQLAARQETRKG